LGLLKSPESEENCLDSNGKDIMDEANLKDTSPFKDLMATMEKPADLTAYPGTPAALIHQHNVTSPPKSADYCSKKTSFFQVSLSKKNHIKKSLFERTRRRKIASQFFDGAGVSL
jgi:hypothetical protein